GTCVFWFSSSPPPSGGIMPMPLTSAALTSKPGLAEARGRKRRRRFTESRSEEDGPAEPRRSHRQIYAEITSPMTRKWPCHPPQYDAEADGVQRRVLMLNIAAE
ncbi:MAG: hypothetical protein ACP5P4_03485, partial [Steroidobacteraceae bacterium]